MVVISHDRYLIERICDSTWALFGDGSLTNLPGGIAQYLDRRREMRSGTTGSGSSKVGSSQAASGQTAEGRAADAQSPGTADAPAERPAVSAAEHREARKAMNRAERQIEQLSRREDELHAALVAAATDPERLVSLNTELRQVVSDKEAAEAAWLEAAEAIE